MPNLKVYGVEFGVLQKRTMFTDDPDLSKSRKIHRRVDESLNIFFHAEAKDFYRQLYKTKCWIS